ncbi:MAG: hypothetical protein PVF63_04310 [Gammaproteobacteria bacterium]|jgi:hypothetical protein
MKKSLAVVALTITACTTPAFADVGISVRIGEPGFYGQLDIGSYGSPRLLYSQPVIVVNRHRNIAPIYLRVPRDHSRHWNRYCRRYDACARPVYFVRDEWYRDVYAPGYRQRISRHWRDGRWNDRRAGRHKRRGEHRRRHGWR